MQSPGSEPELTAEEIAELGRRLSCGDKYLDQSARNALPRLLSALAEAHKRCAVVEAINGQLIEDKTAGESWRKRAQFLEGELAERERELASRDESNPCAHALNELWRDVILKHKPEYGDWEYPAQAYRHLLAEFDSLRAELAARERRIAELEAMLRRCIGLGAETEVARAALAAERTKK